MTILVLYLSWKFLRLNGHTYWYWDIIQSITWCFYLKTCSAFIHFRVIRHFFKQFLASSKWYSRFECVSGPYIQNFRKIGPKLRLLQLCPAWLGSRQNRPIGCVRLLQFVFSLAQPQFLSDFSEILDIRSWNTFKLAVSFWACLKRWWITLM